MQNNNSFRQIHKDRIYDNLTASDLTTGDVMFQDGAGLQHNIGTVTQQNSLSTSVTLNSICGIITLFDVLPGATNVVFQLINTSIKSTSLILLTCTEAKSPAFYPSVVYAYDIIDGECVIIVRTLDPDDTESAPKINFYIINPIV